MRKQKFIRLRAIVEASFLAVCYTLPDGDRFHLLRPSHLIISCRIFFRVSNRRLLSIGYSAQHESFAGSL